MYFPQLTCVEGGCNGQVLFTGGTLGVVSCWKLANTPTVSATSHVYFATPTSSPVAMVTQL